ncbi:hypothetical protein BOO91_21070, partial [Vibrio navarrensis]|uniref:hypothetical protein n=1 Tax=Vibrio navarrensis TaxID=29495 RepID=UPI001D05B33F|nr:hypothetical protein [Vibrio navarrensis]
MHASLLNRALCLITQNQLVASFLCSIGLLVLCFSAIWLRLALFSGQLFFSAGNSKSCLSQFFSKHEVGAAGSIRNLNCRFLSIGGQSSKLDFQIMSRFGFFGLGFCL